MLRAVYFARDSSYSSSTTYSKPNASREQRMFACSVIIGEYCKGVKDAAAPAARVGTQLFDTTVDDVFDPSIFVTYHDSQAYPDYLITFKQ